MSESSKPSAKSSASLEAWVDELGDDLFRFAKSRLRDGDAAEEVVQETFVAAVEHLEQFQGRGTPRAWLMGILRRKIVDYVRRLQHTKVIGDDPRVLESCFDQRGFWKRELRQAPRVPLDSLERADFWRILRACLDALPRRQAAAFTLRELDDQSSDQICKELGVSASNLWVLLHRARLQLANCMQARWRSEG